MLTYKQSGVDIDEGNRAVDLIKGKIKTTYDNNVIGDLGNFSGLYSLKDFTNMTEPVLLSSTDGVGTKLKLAQMMDKHDTVGIDLVAMCVNDLICQGARPLFFLDYIATGKLVAEQVEQIVSGIVEGCKMAGCALVGGETAEMPGMYSEDEYDLAGFSLHIVDVVDVVVLNQTEHAAHPSDDACLFTVMDMAAAYDVMTDGFLQPSVILSAADGIAFHLSGGFDVLFGEVMVIFGIVIFAQTDAAAFTVGNVAILDNPAL